MRDVGVRYVEARYLVPDADSLLVALRTRGIELTSPVRHDDQFYAPDSWPHGAREADLPLVRLRTIGRRTVLSLERPVEAGRSFPGAASGRIETEVADRDAIHGILRAMGFSATSRVTVVHREARINDLSLSVDEVEDRGAVLELARASCDDVPAEVVRAELADVVASLGIGASRIDERSGPVSGPDLPKG